MVGRISINAAGFRARRSQFVDRAEGNVPAPGVMGWSENPMLTLPPTIAVRPVPDPAAG